MAYKITNISLLPVNVSGEGAPLEVGKSRSVSEIGTNDILLQERGLIEISRIVPDDSKDDARFVEVINDPLLAALDAATVAAIGQAVSQDNEDTVPDTVGVLNVPAALKDTWYEVSARIPDIKAWKLQLRRSEDYAAFDYKYSELGTDFMTCLPGEAITADTDFPALYVRVPEYDAQTIELEYWTRVPSP